MRLRKTGAHAGVRLSIKPANAKILKKKVLKEFFLPTSAAAAKGGHLHLSKLPDLQPCFLDLQAFLPLWQRIKFFETLTGAHAGAPMQIYETELALQRPDSLFPKAPKHL